MEQKFADYDELLDNDSGDDGNDDDDWAVDEDDYAYNFVADAMRLQGFFMLASFGMGIVVIVAVVAILAMAGAL